MTEFRTFYEFVKIEDLRNSLRSVVLIIIAEFKTICVNQKIDRLVYIFVIFCQGNQRIL